MKDIAVNQKNRLKYYREMNSKVHVDIEDLESDIKEIDDLKKQLSKSKSQCIYTWGSNQNQRIKNNRSSG